MSDNLNNARRIAARIVSVARIEPGLPPPRRPMPEPEQPAQRPRAYGAPLASSSRFGQKSIARSTPPTQPQHSIPEFEDLHEEGSSGGALASLLGGAVEKEGERFEIDGPTIIWEQPPVPKDMSVSVVPRWITDVNVEPDEEESAQLGAHLALLVNGFTKFFNSPYLVGTGQWRARLPMPPLVIPDTYLDVDMSPLHARLRFETQHEASRKMLNGYVDQLEGLVRAALGDERDIEVSLW